MSPAEPHDPLAPRTEKDDVPARRIWLTGAVTVAVIVASVITADLLRKGDLRGDAHGHSPAPVPLQASEQIGIVEQTPILDARRGLDERAPQKESLRHFGWIDRAHGVARIPIERAMDLVADPAVDVQALALPTAAVDGGPRGGP